MVKDSAPHQSPKVEGTGLRKRTKKVRKAAMQSTAQGSGNAQSSTPQLPPTVEEQLDLQLQQVQDQQPVASPAGNELAMAQHRAEPPEAAAHSAVLSQAVQDAVNRLIAANWDIGLAAATQALHRLSITMALQILETVTIISPVDINAWVREQAMAALSNQPPSNTQPQGTFVPYGAPPWQEAHSPRPLKLSALQISKQIAAFGRYPNARPVGMMTDSEGRLSLNNLMATWGTAHGLSADQVKSVLQQHGATDKGQRFTITAVHNDLFVEVSKSTRHKAPRTKHSNRSYPSAIGAPLSPRRRKYR